LLAPERGQFKRVRSSLIEPNLGVRSSNLFGRAAPRWLPSAGLFSPRRSSCSAHSPGRPVQPAGIRVDATPLRENAGDPTATWVEHELPGALKHALAGRAVHGALVVRIDTLTLGPNTPASIPAARPRTT
jgi:hypothetical protein